MSKQSCVQEIPNGHKPLDFPEVNAVINDAEWRCNVALMVESEASQVAFAQIFQVATKTEHGPFMSITLASIIKDLKSFKDPVQEKSGSPTSKKSAKTPPKGKGVKTPPSAKSAKTPPTTGTTDDKSMLENTLGIENICKKILKTKNAVIPPAFMALLVKSKIIKLREEYLNKLYLVKEEDKTPAQNKKNMKSKSDHKSNKSNKSEKVEKVKSENISKKHKESEREKSGPNISSKDVQVEGKNNKISVSPFAGPNLYIVFSGFYDGLMPFEMIRVGIPLNVVIKLINEIQEPQRKLTSALSIKSRGENEADENKSTGKISVTSKKSSKTAVKKHGKKKGGTDSHVQDNINNFWTDFDNNINSLENVALTSGLLTNTIRLPFKPDLVDPKDIEIRKEVYQIVSLNMYQIQNIIGEQAQYIRCMKVYQFEEKIILPENMYIYESMVELVPLECTNIEYIVHCIIEQVSVLLANCESSDLDEVQPKIESDVNSVCNNETMNTSVEVPNITPIILKHGDTIGINTFHINVPELDLSKITTEVLSGMPIVCLWELYPDHHKDLLSFKLEFQFQKLLNSWTGPPISRNLFLIYLHQFVFLQMQSFHKVLEWPDKTMCEEQENLIFSSCQLGSITNPEIAKNKCEYKHRTLADKKVTRQQQLVGLKMFLECSEIKSLIESFKFTLSPDFTVPVEADMNYYHFIEEMGRHNLFQAFRESLFNFNTVEYTYYPLTDKILLWFYNNTNDDGLNDGLETASPITPVGLRDFVKFIYNEQASCTSSQNEVIKAQDEVIDLGLSTGIKLPSLHDVEDSQPLYIGYDLGPSRVQITERCKKFYFKNETTITIKINDWLYGSKLLSLYISELDNILRYHKYLRHDNHSALHNSHDLRVQFETSNGIIFNFSKPGKKLNQEQNVGSQDTIKSNDKIKKASNNNAHKEVNNKSKTSIRSAPSLNVHKEVKEKSKTSIGSAPTLTSVLAKANKQVTPVCDLNICLPNGLFVELVRDDMTGDIFYIRQSNTVKCCNTNELIIQEEYRCYLRNGTILIFYTDGRVEIFYNNTTRVICNGFQLPDPPPKSAFSIDKTINISTEGLKSQSEAIDTQKGKKVSAKMSSVLRKPVSMSQTSNAKEEKRAKKVSTKKSIGSQKSVNIELRKSLRGSKISKSLTALESTKEKTSIEASPPAVDAKLLNILEHNVITWSGENLKFIRGKITERENQFTLRSAMDVANQELYTTRGDCSTTLLSSDSQLSTGFGDGTRITNTLTLEPRRVTVISVSNEEPKHEMIDENFFQYVRGTRFMETEVDSISEVHVLAENKFSDTSRLSQDTIMETAVHSKSEVTIGAEHEFSDASRFASKASTLPDMDEAEFVSILQGVCMEHPNYATVEYTPQNNAIKLSLPGNIVVLVLPDGTYEIEISEKTMVCISEKGFEFSRINEKMVKQSVSTIQWSALDSAIESNILSQTIDCFNNVFTVYCNGETEKTIINGKDKILSNSSSEISLNESRNSRFFIFNRDLSGYEMLQTGSVLGHLQDTSKSKHFFKIENKNEHGRSGLRLLTTQRPLLMNRSEEFRMQYRLSCIRPTVMRRNDLNPPWCSSLSPWLFENKAKKTKVRSCQLNSDSTSLIPTNTSYSITPQLEDSNKYEKPYKAVVIRKLKQTAEIDSDALTEMAETLKTYDDANKVLYTKYTGQTMQDIQSEEEVAAQYDMLTIFLNTMTTGAEQHPISPLGWEAFKFHCLPSKNE